jgi:hypothetical protein
MGIESDGDVELPKSYWRRWYVYASWPAGLVAFILIAVMGLPGGPELVILGFVLVFPLWVWTILGFYWDASALKEAEWQPWWPVWIVSTLILSPVLISSFYLLKRSLRTGVPWNQSGSKFSSS